MFECAILALIVALAAVAKIFYSVASAALDILLDGRRND